MNEGEVGWERRVLYRPHLRKAGGMVDGREGSDRCVDVLLSLSTFCRERAVVGDDCEHLLARGQLVLEAQLKGELRRSGSVLGMGMDARVRMRASLKLRVCEAQRDHQLGEGRRARGGEATPWAASLP